MPSQHDKALAFRALHEREGAFVIPNPWDAGSARLLAGLGFEALATTSLGVANMLGTAGVTPQQILENCRAICGATPLPVNADLENGGADAPEAAAQIIPLAAEAGVVGGSIEDYSGDPEAPIYDFALAVERVAAAAEAARALPFPFTLTARAENFLHGRKDLDDTVRRLQAFAAAGADVLYAPGLYDLETIRTVVSALDRPFNLVMGFADQSLTLDQLAEAGVKRISVGGALSRIALNAVLGVAQELREGRFTGLAQAIAMPRLYEVWSKGGD
jgi:2-methylisocitrate lyase-like PEP mutase family enzyme